MSGGASGLLSTGSRTPPRAPQNSFDYDSPNWQYSDPGNPFKDPEDPFLDWRSSDAINSPSETASALAAAVAEYGAGPQKPLTPVPVSTLVLQHLLVQRITRQAYVVRDEAYHPSKRDTSMIPS